MLDLRHRGGPSLLVAAAPRQHRVPRRPHAASSTARRRSSSTTSEANRLLTRDLPRAVRGARTRSDAGPRSPSPRVRPGVAGPRRDARCGVVTPRSGPPRRCVDRRPPVHVLHLARVAEKAGPVSGAHRKGTPSRAGSRSILGRANATDHPHQVGLWFGYGDVNGVDFWNNSTALPAERQTKMGAVGTCEIVEARERRRRRAARRRSRVGDAGRQRRARRGRDVHLPRPAGRDRSIGTSRRSPRAIAGRSPTTRKASSACASLVARTADDEPATFTDAAGRRRQFRCWTTPA